MSNSNRFKLSDSLVDDPRLVNAARNRWAGGALRLRLADLSHHLATELTCLHHSAPGGLSKAS